MKVAVHPVDPRLVARAGSVEWLAIQTGLPRRLWTDPALVRYATRARRCRRWIVIGTTSVGVAWDVLATFLGGPLVGWTYALVVGWFAARIIPELAARNGSVGTVRVAGLSSRSPLRLVTPTARRWLLGSVALAVTGAVLSWWNGQPPSADVVPALASVTVAVCGSLAVVHIAHRSQPAGSADDVVVNDAIRRVGTTGVVASWAALQYMAAVFLVPTPRTMSESGWPWVTTAMTYACLIGVVASWMWVPTRLMRPAPAGEVGS